MELIELSELPELVMLLELSELPEPVELTELSELLELLTLLELDELAPQLRARIRMCDSRCCLIQSLCHCLCTVVLPLPERRALCNAL